MDDELERNDELIAAYYRGEYPPIADVPGARWRELAQPQSAEQQARDLLERCGVEDAQSFTAGDVVELANLIAKSEEYRRQLAAIRGRCVGFTPDPSVVDEVLAILDQGASGA